MNVTRILVFLCALSNVAAAQVQIGGFKIGPKPKPAPQAQPQPQGQPSTGGSSTESAAPAQPDNRAATEAWRAAKRRHEDLFARLHDYATNLPTGPVGTGQYADRAQSDLKSIAKLDEIKKACADGVYNGERDGNGYNEQYMTAKTMCPLIADAEAHTKKALRAWAMAYGESTLRNLDSTLERIEKEKQVSLKDTIEGVDVAERRKYIASFVKGYFEALGEPVPDELLAKVDGRVAKMKEAIATVAATGKIEKAAGKDAGAEKAIADYYKGRYPKIQIKRVWMEDATWKVKQNGYGAITNRYKNASMLVKAKDADYCIVVPAAVGQTYAGGGKYAAGYNVDEYLSGAPVKCK